MADMVLVASPAELDTLTRLAFERYEGDREHALSHCLAAWAAAGQPTAGTWEDGKPERMRLSRRMHGRWVAAGVPVLGHVLAGAGLDVRLSRGTGRRGRPALGQEPEVNRKRSSRNRAAARRGW